MIRKIIFSVFLIICLSVYADRQNEYKNLRNVLQNSGVTVSENTDTVVSYKGYHVKIKQENGVTTHIGLNIFNPEFKKMMDPDLLDYLEREMLKDIIAGENSSIIFRVGNISDMKRINPDTPCTVSISSGVVWGDWTLSNGNHILISAPVSYDLIRAASRSEIERDFISMLKNSNSQRNIDIKIDPTVLQPYAETEYILPGPSYINEYITRHIYLTSDREPIFVWDAKRPLESINNLFICGAGKVNPDVNLTIIKHEYGEKEQIKTDIENLIAVAEAEGCTPYWGVESYENGKVTGSLFLYNSNQGYDHIFKIECRPEEIIAGKGTLNAKAYLYIPSNNVSNLYEPYRVKTENEKIKYRKN